MPLIPSYIEFVAPEPRTDHAIAFNHANWAWLGGVLSTSVRAFPCNLGPFATVANARFVVAWIPNPGAVARLVSADSGPENIQNVGSWVVPTVTGRPTVSATDVRVPLQGIIDAGVWKQLGVQFSGQGIVTRATLELVWEV